MAADRNEAYWFRKESAMWITAGRRSAPASSPGHSRPLVDEIDKSNACRKARVTSVQASCTEFKLYFMMPEFTLVLMSTSSYWWCLLPCWRLKVNFTTTKPLRRPDSVDDIEDAQ